MTVKYANSATTTLLYDITALATSLIGRSSDNFPALAVGEHTYLTLSNSMDTEKEIVKCTAISGTTFTVVRGQESTTAITFSAGDHVQLRITAGLIGDAIADAVIASTATAVAMAIALGG